MIPRNSLSETASRTPQSPFLTRLFRIAISRLSIQTSNVYKYSMRNFINLIESSDGFRLHPKLDPQNYQITDSLRGVKGWRAKVLAANSAGPNDKIGDWNEVGYIMISLTDNTIVPIARADEHNVGFDLMHDLGIRGKYQPIYFGGGNYIYSESDIPTFKVALTKWLAWGGPDTYLSGSNSLHGKLIRFSDFVEHDGFMEIVPGEISPIAKRFMDVLRGAAEAMRAARNTPDKRSVVNAAFVAALKVPQYLGTLGFNFLGGYTLDDLDKLVTNIKTAKSENDVQRLEELIFGFDGIKNRIHNELRQNVRLAKEGKPSYFFERDAKSLWGDPELAVDMLGRF